MFRGRRVHALLLAGCLLLARPAQAIILRAGANAEEDARLEEAAHGAGAGHRCALAIRLPGGSPDSGTGVYLGPSADGKRGLVLTAAHLFAGDPRGSPAFRRILLAFGPEPLSALCVEAERVLFHPGWLRVPEPPPPFGQEGTRWGADLAILEFDLQAHGRALGELGVQPAALCAEDDWAWGEGRSCQIVGFGLCGTCQGTTWTGTGRVHAAETLVTRGELGRPDLLTNGSPMAQEARKRLGASARDPALACRFAMDEAPFEAEGILGRLRQRVQIHANHGIPAPGDGGGPLLVAGPAGARVAGIASPSRTLILYRTDTQAEVRCIVSVWEPVMGLGPWIQGIREGAPARAWTLEARDGAWHWVRERAEPPPAPKARLPCAIL